MAVIAGDDVDREKPRKVLAVDLREGRVLVEGANLVKKHMRPTAQDTKGQILTKEAPIHISNVMLWDKKAGRPVRISRDRGAQGVRRISKKTSETI